MSKKIALIGISVTFALISYNSFAGPVSDNTVVEIGNYNSTISPGMEELIDQSITTRKNKEALSLLDSKISKDPSNTKLLYKKASIYADQGDWNNAIGVLDQITLLQPDNADANKLRKIIEEKKLAEPRNELGLDVDEAYVNDLSAYWNYSSVHYYRLTDKGKFGGHINYAQRYGTTAEQYQLEAYPKFAKNLTGAFTFGYANSTQILFPSLQYMLEVYLNVSHGFEFSLGQGGKKFSRFSNQKIFIYTGTIGKYIGDYFIWLRPSFFTPKSAKFFELGMRKYFSDVDNYVSLVVGAGKLPDIGDIPPLDKMIIIRQQGIALSGQFSATKNIFLKGGIGYIKQFFPTGLKREIGDVNVGIVWRF